MKTKNNPIINCHQGSWDEFLWGSKMSPSHTLTQTSVRQPLGGAIWCPILVAVPQDKLHKPAHMTYG